MEEVNEVNPKTQWYRDHKDEPHIRECMRKASKKYYYANVEKERARCLARYYRLKGLPVPDPNPTPPA
jgi:hypothetical protein